MEPRSMRDREPSHPDPLPRPPAGWGCGMAGDDPADGTSWVPAAGSELVLPAGAAALNSARLLPLLPPPSCVPVSPPSVSPAPVASGMVERATSPGLRADSGGAAGAAGGSTAPPWSNAGCPEAAVPGSSCLDAVVVVVVDCVCSAAVADAAAAAAAV